MSHIGHYENQPSLSLSSADMSREKYSPLEEMANLKVSEAEPVSQSRSWSDEFAAFEAGNVADSQQKGPLEEQNFLYNGEINDISQGWAIHNDFEAYQFSGNDIAHTDMSCEESVRRGVELREQGRLTGAVICFERALRRKESDLSPEMKAKAWYLLGLSLADTDDDQGAIAAFASGITEWNGIVQGERREDNPFFARSLVGLAVSYTNELNIEKAIYHMRVWTDLWEREHGISNVRSGEEIVTIPGMDGIDGLLERLQRGAKEHREDVEVVVVMGILQNVKRNYEAAADAFRIAVSLRADDAGLWNKLGATLANGKQKDNALRAYRKAVDLKPQLIRAWVNVGTAYANSGEFSKATRYYLKAVSMGREQSELGRRDDEGEDGAMGHVWGYLRLSVLSMGRLDALDLIETRDLDGLRQHFTF